MTQGGLEQYLDSYHQLLERVGKATVRKVPTPIAVVARGTTKRQGLKGALSTLATLTGVRCPQIVVGRLEAARWVDFVGILSADGRGVAIEAKETTQNTLPISRITVEQQQMLEAYEAAGGVAAIYARIAGVDVFVPWELAKKSRSINPAVIPQCKVGRHGWIAMI